MAAWTTDIMGSTQCDALGGETTPTKNGNISTKSWCYEMKVIEAFSWMIFCLFAIFLWILIALTSRARVLGHPFAWAEPIFELPWFGELPGWPGPYGNAAVGGQMPYPMGVYPNGGMGYANGGYVVQQNPGHSVVIQQGAGGPTITQVPGSVSSV
ncbi:hypothetical protein AcW1_004284 [Taiwanofungus camphoratus]|nr:hypothetical protein AcW2_006705 [Antrodia cinnamomea]KAI0939174.1 hypothetical protein AcV5_000665 [Antrodia cinnamomea]KAI0952092.1 hypothetical protein AcV7_008007 [Antrodia cinnamomea]KAI0959466.1 hypothetical protein AcW1_004284 [Antrodia cinnamomea]